VILVDSGVWIDYFRGMQTSQTDRLDGLLDGHREKCLILIELVGRVGIEPTTN
jgi:hypothetical protein